MQLLPLMQQAEDLKKNSLDTGTLTYSNIQNESEYDAKGISLSAGFNAGRTDSTDKNNRIQCLHRQVKSINMHQVLQV